MGADVAGTCDIQGNARFDDGDPVIVSYPPDAHFADHFVRGQTINVLNSLNPAILPDGCYFIRDTDDDRIAMWNYTLPGDPPCSRAFAIDNATALVGLTTYGDIFAHPTLLLTEFELRNSAVVSRIVVSNLSDEDAYIAEGDDMAAKLTVTDGIGSYELEIPNSGQAEHSFNLDSAPVFSAGSLLMVNLQRLVPPVVSGLPGKDFNASGLKIFIYLRYMLG